MSPGKRALLMLPNFRGGGAEKNMLRYGDLLLDAGFEVIFLTLSARQDHQLLDGARYVVLPETPRWAKLLRSWHTARALRLAVERLGGERGFDIKISTLPTMDRVVRRARLPNVIYRIANHPPSEKLTTHARSKRRRGERRWRTLYGRQKLLCVSSGLEKTVRQLLSRNDEAIRTLYNPFDISRIRALSKVPDPAVPTEDYIIHIGRYSAQKRFDILLETYKRSGIAAKLILLGNPHPDLTALIERQGLRDRVVRTGYQTNPYPWILGAKALVLTSDWEGLPGVLIEALICGTPVVSTDCPSGPAEILVGPLREFLVPMRDIDAIAHALRRVLAAPPVITEDMVMRFGHERFLEGLEAFAEEKTPRL